MIGEDAVFACNGDNVRYDAYGNKVEQRLKVVGNIQPVAYGKALHKLITNAATR